MRVGPLLAASLSACSVEIEPPPLCEMPSNMRSWRGAHVSWSGFVVDTHQHGVFIGCRNDRGGVWLDWNEQTEGHDGLETALRQAAMGNHLLCVRLEGRLGWDEDRQNEVRPVLHVTAVRQSKLIPMSYRDQVNLPIPWRGQLR